MSVAHHAKSAVLWNASFNLLREVLLRVGAVFIFRRLLTPADYGMFNYVNDTVGFLALFGVNNFVAHTLQLREDKDVRWQEHFTAGAFFQLPLFGLTNLVALSLHWWPEFAAKAPYLHVMSLLFLLDWPCEFRRKQLERSFNWARLRILHSIALITGFFLTLVLARAHWGAWALLLPALLMSLPFTFDLFVLQGWRPTWAWNWADYQAAWRFGWTRIASGLAFTGRKLIESTVIIWVLGDARLGILNGAVGLAQVLCRGFAEQLMYAIYAVLTRVNPDPANVVRVNALVLRVVAWITIPMAVLGTAIAGPLLLTAYGEKWLESIPLLPAALLAGATIALGQTANQLLLAKERLRECLLADIAVLVGTVLALALALESGLKSYLFAIAAVQFAVLLLMLGWLLRAGLLRVAGLALAFVPALLAAVVACTACEATLRLLHTDASRFLTAVIYGVGFWVTYLAILRLGFRAALSELVSYFPRRELVRRVLFLPA